MMTYRTKRFRALRPAVALAATAFFCATPHADPLPCGSPGVIDTLFEFSQRAERPQDQTTESLNCPAEGTSILTVSRLSAQQFPSSITAAVTEELTVRDVPHIPFAELSQDERRLYVACPRISISISELTITRDIAVEMMVLRANSGADTVRLDVVTREPRDPDSEEPPADWAPVIDPNGLITFPGTNPEDGEQILANLFHNPCLFPAAHLALHALCTMPNAPPATDTLGTAGTPETSEVPASGWLRTDENRRPNVAGHSLGGAVTQYIAITAPPPPVSRSADDDSHNACSGVNAYAFGSTGLTIKTAGDAPSIHGELTSYASDCDFLVHCVPSFDDRVQPGRVLTLHSYSHWINDIQKDLCNCRRWAGTDVLYDLDTRAEPPSNLSLFGLARDSNGYCPSPPPSIACSDIPFANRSGD